MPFAEDQHMIQARVASRSDAQHRGFAKAIRGAMGLAYSHRSDSIRECLPISSIIVADQIPRRRVPREYRHDLLRQPLRRRMCGYREPQQSSSIERGQRLISAWNERQAKHMPVSRRRSVPSWPHGIGFLWVRCAACRTTNAIDLHTRDRTAKGP